MKEFVGLRAKRYSYLKDNNNEDEKSKRHTNVCRKRKISRLQKFLEAVQIENKMNHLEKNKIDVDSLKEDKKKIQK